MKKFFAVIVAALLVSLALITSPASATEPDTTKKVTICHYKATPGANEGSYSRIEVPISGWYNGHRAHGGDIWAAFSYVDKSGKTVNVPAQGDTSLLAFEDCAEPAVDEEIAKPEPSYVDKCGVIDDVDLAVAPGRGYTVGTLVKDGQSQSITVTTDDGFVFTDGSTSVTYTHVFSNETVEECDLPETGAAAVFNTTGGIFGAIAAGFGVMMMFLYGRRNKATA